METTTTTRRGGRKAGQGSKWIRKTTRRRLYLRDRCECVYCGRSILDAGVTATLDHVVPCELGGTNEHTNLVTACLSCNSAKRALPLSDFINHLADRGIDPAAVRRNVRNATRRALPKL